MSTSWPKILLSFCFWQLFASTIALEACRYSPSRDGVCIPYEECEEISGKVYFPNEECVRNTVCCPNAFATPPVNGRVFSGIMPTIHNGDDSSEALPPLPDSVLQIWDVPETDVSPTLSSVSQRQHTTKFQKPSEEDLKQTSQDWLKPETNVQNFPVPNQETSANQQTYPPLPESVLKIWDVPAGDVKPNKSSAPAIAKNVFQNLPQEDFKQITGVMPEQNINEVATPNQENIQHVLPPLPDNILKIWDIPAGDSKRTEALKPDIPKKGLRTPPQAGLKSTPGNIPKDLQDIRSPGKQLNTISPAKRSKPQKGSQNLASPTANFQWNFNKGNNTKLKANVKPKYKLKKPWNQPKGSVTPSLSAAQAKANEELFNRLFNTNFEQLTTKTRADSLPAEHPETLFDFPKIPNTTPMQVVPEAWPRFSIVNRNPNAPLIPNRVWTHVAITLPPPTTTTEQIPHFDEEFYRRLGLAFGAKYDQYNQWQEITTPIVVMESTEMAVNANGETELRNFVENLNPLGVDKLSLEKCGFVHVNHNSSSSNVDTNIAEYPWLALLQYDVGNNGKKFSCGGSLLTERWVLTAASCIKKSLIGVHLGVNEISNKDCTRNKNCFQISQMVKHKDYKPETGEKDIAMIKLKTRVRRSKNIKTICLPTKPEHFKVPYGEKALTIAGWALTREESTKKPKKHTLARQVCQQIHPVDVSQQSKMCLAVGDPVQSSTCSGDHGGPVFWLINDEKDVFTQIGIVPQEMVSCGGADDKPYYVESVADSMDWITNVIAEEK